MRRLLSVIFVFAVATLFAAQVDKNGARTGVWTHDFKAARKLSAQKNLPVLVNFTGSDWCGWCKLMDSKVFGDKAWEDWAKDRIVLAYVDFPRNESLVPKKFRKENAKLQNFYSVRGYPTYVLLAPDGKELGRLGARRDAEPGWFIGEIEKLLPKGSEE